jgi:hypothetical protein
VYAANPQYSFGNILSDKISAVIFDIFFLFLRSSWQLVIGHPLSVTHATSQETDMFKVDHSIPFPIKRSINGVSKYPWPTMQVGDSVFIPGAKDCTCTEASSSRTYAHRHGGKFSCQQVEGGVRIWRIE